jgi:hypothetical protein
VSLLDRFLADPHGWVDRVERAYVAAATSKAPVVGSPVETGIDHDLALAISYAIAARFLAVGTPRTIGLAVDGGDAASAARACITAMRVFFAPREIRLYAGGPLDAHSELMAARVSTIDDVIACDIVCDFLPGVSALANRLVTHARRGCHFNLRQLPAQPPDPSWLTATAGIDSRFGDTQRTVASTTLPRLAAGLDDGRQLDEVSLFAGEQLQIAHAMLASL